MARGNGGATSANQGNAGATRTLTVSEAAHLAATQLVLLRVAARDDQAWLARGAVETLRKLLLADLEQGLQVSGASFLVGRPDDCVTVQGVVYPSAHHATVGQASHLMGLLWWQIDRDGYEAARADAYSMPRTASADDALQHIVRSTGLDAALIETDWPRARAAILHVLSEDWRADFAAIPSRILRERANSGARAAGGAGSTTLPSIDLPGMPQPPELPPSIPPERQTKPLQMKEAAKLLGLDGGNPSQAVRRAGYTHVPRGKLFVFDRKDFAREVYNKILTPEVLAVLEAKEQARRVPG